MVGAAGVFALGGCAVEAPPDDVTRGQGDTTAFERLEVHYNLRLPRDAEDIAWIETRNWDTNQLYLRFATTPDAAEELLADLQVPADGLVAATADSVMALPGDVDGDGHDEDPSVWAPASWTRARAGHWARDSRELAPLVDVVLDETDRDRPVVFLDLRSP